MVDSIAQRINDEPGPGKQDFLISVASYHPVKTDSASHLEKSVKMEEGVCTAKAEGKR